MRTPFALFGLSMLGLIGTAVPSSAAPLTAIVHGAVPSAIQNVLIYCEENGRCIEAPGEGRFRDDRRFDRRRDWEHGRRYREREWDRDRYEWRRHHHRDWRDDRW